MVNDLTAEQIKEKIILITNIFGMKADVASKAMNIKTLKYRKNLSDKVKYFKFTEQNLSDLKKYILEKAEQIQKI